MLFCMYCCIVFSQNLTERSGIGIGNIGLGMKSNRFVLSNDANKSLELSAPDAKTKSEWLSGWFI